MIQRPPLLAVFWPGAGAAVFREIEILKDLGLHSRMPVASVPLCVGILTAGEGFVVLALHPSWSAHRTLHTSACQVRLLSSCAPAGCRLMRSARSEWQRSPAEASHSDAYLYRHNSWHRRCRDGEGISTLQASIHTYDEREMLTAFPHLNEVITKMPEPVSGRPAAPVIMTAERVDAASRGLQSGWAKRASSHGECTRKRSFCGGALYKQS